jgi:uroporphyrinogen decarboxylase
MTRRKVVKTALQHKKPSYVSWNFGFTQEAQEKLAAHYGTNDLDDVIKPHFLKLGGGRFFFSDIGGNCAQDTFGVVWDRSRDKDIGIPKGCVLPEPTLKGYDFPDPLGSRFFADIEEQNAKWPDRFRDYSIGFSLYERAWTMRGMENLLMDFILV